MSEPRYALAHKLVHFDGAVTNTLQLVIPDAVRPAIDLASTLGATPGWVLLIALSFWWSGSRLGVRVALAVSASAVLNVLAKWTLLQPRPYFVSSGIAPLEASDGFGMPSGHAQGTATAWTGLAWWTGRRTLWIAGATMAFFAGFARVYYGVHSTLQVVCGWTVGVAVVVAASRLEPVVVRRFEAATPATRWAAAVAPAIAVLTIGFGLRAVQVQRFSVPAEWVANHRAASLELDPTRPTADLRLLDATPLLRWLGGLLGASLVAAWYGVDGRRTYRPASSRERALVTLIGAVTMALLLAAGEAAVLRWGGAAELVRFALLLWTIGVVAPTVGGRAARAFL